MMIWQSEAMLGKRTICEGNSVEGMHPSKIYSILYQMDKQVGVE